MRLTATGCIVLLLLFCCCAAWAASSDGPVTEIVLDCSRAMKATGPEHDSSIQMAWQALAHHYLGLAAETTGTRRLPALRLAGGSAGGDNQWRPDQLVHDGRSGHSPFRPGCPLPPAPAAGGLLPLSQALSAAAGDLARNRNRSQGYILLIAAGWEGGTGNPHDLANGSQSGNGAPVIHVIGLAPLPAEARQLRQLAAKSGGIYREVAGPAGLEQALQILAGSGGILFSASTADGEPPPPGSRLSIADRRGWYRRDFDYQAWAHRGGQTWVPAGPYDLELHCSGRSSPFPAPPVSVERGRLSRCTLEVPHRGQLTVQVTSPEKTARRPESTISIFDGDGQPVYRLNYRDQYSIPLYPGEYLMRVRPYPDLNSFGEETRWFRIKEGEPTAIYIHLPAEGLLVFEQSGPAPQVRIEDRQGAVVWNGMADGTLSLPAGRYRMRLLNEDRELVKSKRFRIRGGETRRLGPFQTD